MFGISFYSHGPWDMFTSTLKNLHRALCFYAARRLFTNVGFWLYRQNMLAFHFIDSKHLAIPVYTRLFSIKSAATHLASCTWGMHGLCFGEEAGARNLVFFRVKWLQVKGTSCVRRLRLRSVCRFFLPQCNGGLKLLWVCLCVRSYRMLWNPRLQIALEWLHDSCRLLFWSCSVRR